MNNLSNKQLCDLISTVVMEVNGGVLDTHYIDTFLESNDIVITKEVYDHIIDVIYENTLPW